MNMVATHNYTKYNKSSEWVGDDAERLEGRLWPELSGVEVRDRTASRRAIKFNRTICSAAIGCTEQVKGKVVFSTFQKLYMGLHARVE